MVRKLVAAISLALVTSSVSALGLGEITTRSALNQEYDADIQLISVDSNEIDNIRVSLAKIKAFAQAGVQRPFFLSSLKFKPAVLEDGSTVIRVTTNFPVREPFLDFLIEVNWPRGSLVKEYTVLLDPPLTQNKRPVPVAAPTLLTNVSTGFQEVDNIPAKNIDSYGPIAPNETLWGIARKVRQKGVSIEQMMMALLQANPNAFINQNINFLKKGASLRVPSKVELLNLSRIAANAAYRQQQDEWLESKTQALVKVTDAESEVATKNETAELHIVTKKPEEEGDLAASDGLQNQNKDEITKVDDLDQELMIAREEAELSRQESEKLSENILSLEDQLNDLNRLLELKDNQLAQLQANVTESSDEMSKLSAVNADENSENVNDSLDKNAITEEGNKADENGENNLIEPTSSSNQEETPTDKSSIEEFVEDESSNSVSTQKPWYEEFWMYIAAGGVFLIALLAGLFLRKGSKDDEPFDTETTISVDHESILQEASSLTDSGPESEILDSDTSFLSEFSSEELNALQEETSDVDTISEADVYIAYGRYQQAEELLAQAIKKEPEQASIKFKLLEVYYATRNKDAFAALANDIDATENPDAWDHVVGMGQEIDKSNPLFSRADISTELDNDNLPEADDFDLDSIASSLSEEFDETVSELNLDDNILSEMESLSDGLDSTLSIDEDPLETLESLELDVPDLDDVSENSNDHLGDLDLENIQIQESNADTVDDLDMDMDAAETELQAQLNELSDMSTLDLESSNDSLDSDSGLDNLGELEMGDLEALETELGNIDGDLALGHNNTPVDNDSDLTLDDAFDHLLEEEDDDDLASVLNVPDVEGDDTDTKLDLARAYIEMGDIDGAKGMLEEVVAEGNVAQKASAENLIEAL